MKGIRNREINRLCGEGHRVKELAMMFGVSTRTIQRALKDTTPPTEGKTVAGSIQMECIER